VTANEFIGLNLTIVSIINMQTSFDSLSINQLTVNYTTLNGPLTCTGNGSIASSCIDFPFLSVENVFGDPITKNVDLVEGSGISIGSNPGAHTITIGMNPLSNTTTTCSTTLPNTCLPLISVEGVTGSLVTKDIDLIAGAGILITATPSAHTIEFNVIPDVLSTSTQCTSMLNDSCVPTRIKTINSIHPDGALNFNISGSASVVVTPGANGITLTSPPDTLSGSTTCSSALPASCVDISGETCLGGPVNAN
jgi:hypothetical protein